MDEPRVGNGGGPPRAGLHHSRLTLPQRGARLTTTLAVRSPKLWRLLRVPFRRYFDALAPRWDTIVGTGGLDALAAALAETPPPRHASTS